MNEHSDDTATESTDHDCDHAPFDQGAVLSSRSVGVECPRCHAELMMGHIASCEFAGCRQCHGMLFQQDVFAGLIHHLRATSSEPPQIPDPINLDELKQQSVCPGCGLPFETHAYGGPGNSVIDTCTGCGLVWFDRGEFDNLVRAPGRR